MSGNTQPRQVNPAQLAKAKCGKCSSTWRRPVILGQSLYDRLDPSSAVQGAVTFFFCASCGVQLDFHGNVVPGDAPEAAPPEAYEMEWRPRKENDYAE